MVERCLGAKRASSGKDGASFNSRSLWVVRGVRTGCWLVLTSGEAIGSIIPNSSCQRLNDWHNAVLSQNGASRLHHSVSQHASWLTGLWPSELGVPATQITFCLPRVKLCSVLAGTGLEDCSDRKSHWHPHTAGVDLRDQIKLLQKLGFDEAEEIAGPRALAEVKCALTDDWYYAYEPGLQARYRADLAEHYHGGSPWRVKPSILPNHMYPDIWVGDGPATGYDSKVSEQPWMLWVSFPGPRALGHSNPWAGVHRKVQLPPARPRPNWISRQPLHSQCRQRELQWEQTPKNEEINTLRSDYADHLTLLDYQLSRLLKDLPELKRTSITIVNDHGELLVDAGFLYKSCFLEGAIRSLALHHRPSILKRNKGGENQLV